MLGLIQVMKNLANIDEVGHGIAVAFVATVYGVGSANVLFLPVASKIKSRMEAEIQRKELIVEAVAGIVEGSESQADPHEARSLSSGRAEAKKAVRRRRGAAQAKRRLKWRREARMARRRSAAQQENHDRWLISYADFITLLFAFFVVMFASSQADKGKAQQVSDSVKKALDGEKLSTMIAAVLGGTVDDTRQGQAMMRGPGGAQKPTGEKRVRSWRNCCRR